MYPGAAKFLGLDINNSKLIVCHLGNGSSVSAVQNGKCVDTSMGLTPLEGLVMGTRSGSIDPAIVEFIAKKENLDIDGVMDVLNKKSGVYGLTKGLSSDFRDLEERLSRAMSWHSWHWIFSPTTWQNTLAHILPP